MGLLTPNSIADFGSLYTLQLRYLLSAETQILKGLDDMVEHSVDIQLKQAFQSHRQETEVHVGRLEDLIAERNDGDADDKRDAIAAAIIGSGENIVAESEVGAVRDAGLLSTARRSNTMRLLRMEARATGPFNWDLRDMLTCSQAHWAKKSMPTLC